MLLDVYSDETFVDNRYIGIGCLFVPHNKKYKLYKKLSNYRCLNTDSKKWVWNFDECNNFCKEERHKNNNCEIHHTELSKNSSYSRKEISKKWINLLMSNNKHDQKMIYFKILYIDLEKLDKNFFGEKDVQTNIYQRFFRTIVVGGLNYFFSNKVEIGHIYHDKADAKEQHDFFSWHLGNFIKNDLKRVKIMNKKISFLDSDHKKYLNHSEEIVVDSHFIQFIDLILGTVSQTLFNPSSDVEKIKLSTIIYPLVKELIKNPHDYDNALNYVQKQDISIFPKNQPSSVKDLDEKFRDSRGEFHRNILLKKPKILQKNQSLDKWLKK